jgi:choline-glycine betaine transporter
VFALPFALIILLMVWSLWRTMQQDQHRLERHERDMRKKVKAWASRES